MLYLCHILGLRGPRYVIGFHQLLLLRELPCETENNSTIYIADVNTVQISAILNAEIAMSSLTSSIIYDMRFVR
jgi:hypothetical protein